MKFILEPGREVGLFASAFERCSGLLGGFRSWLAALLGCIAGVVGLGGKGGEIDIPRGLWPGLIAWIDDSDGLT